MLAHARDMKMRETIDFLSEIGQEVLILITLPSRKLSKAFKVQMKD